MRLHKFNSSWKEAQLIPSSARNVVIFDTVAALLAAFVIIFYICPLGALLAGIMFLWVAGKDFTLKAVNEDSKRRLAAGSIRLPSMSTVPALLLP